MTGTESREIGNTLWPRATSLLLLLVGLVLSASSFALVVGTGHLPWHGARDAELQATYQTYRETGILLIKPTGSGSYGVQAPAPGPLTSAAWDDDPGSYIIASLFSHITNSDSPYPGLTLMQALLVALPLLWLPTTVARVFKRARAGYALIALPPLIWLVNHGTLFLGTEYGHSDTVSTLRVYALYGIAASLAFLSLSLLLLLSTYRLRTSVLIAVTLAFGVLSGFGNLSRSLSGMGVALCVGVLWWLHTSGRWRWVMAAIATIVAVALALSVQTGVMNLINTARVDATGQTLEELPDAHAAWHSLYLGLSYPQPINGAASSFDVTWSDEFAWEKAREVNPDVVVASEQYDGLLKDLYLEKVFGDPLGAMKIYLQKAYFTFKHFGAMIALILGGLALALTQNLRLRRPLGVALAITLPTLLLGLVPPIMVMPMLYYYSELSAALGLLAALALGGTVWALSAMPSRVRNSERKRLKDRFTAGTPSVGEPVGISAIIQFDDASTTLHERVGALAGVLSPRDEIIIVGNGSADNTSQALEDLRAVWARSCQLVVRLNPTTTTLGEGLRVGMLASRGKILLLGSSGSVLTAAEYQRIIEFPDEALVAIDSSHGTDTANGGNLRQRVEPRIMTFVREALLESDLAGRLVPTRVDGQWGRSFAMLSRESGPLWATELILAAQQDDVPVCTVTLPSHDIGKPATTTLRLTEAWRSIIEYAKLALNKDDYSNAV